MNPGHCPLSWLRERHPRSTPKRKVSWHRSDHRLKHASVDERTVEIRSRSTRLMRDRASNDVGGAVMRASIAYLDLQSIVLPDSMHALVIAWHVIFARPVFRCSCADLPTYRRKPLHRLARLDLEWQAERAEIDQPKPSPVIHLAASPKRRDSRLSICYMSHTVNML